jgi:hypothetical protein
VGRVGGWRPCWENSTTCRVGFFVLKKSCIRRCKCCREKKSWAVGATDLKETNCSASLERNCCLVGSAVNGQRGRKYVKN